MKLLLAACLLAASVGGDGSLQKDIDLVVRQGRGTPEGRQAWQRLSERKADALPQLLEGMNTKDTVTANWLRTAFEQVLDRELKTGGKQIDRDKLLAFIKDPAKNGRSRRFALEVIEDLQPGTSARLYPEWLDDPEFRFEAVGQVLERAKVAKSDAKLYQLAFDKSRDVQQARDAAAGLQAGNIQVSVAEHLGFFTDWYVIGPFDGMGQKGFHLEYPPEKKVDLTAEYDGQNGKVRWKRFQVKEASPTTRGGHQALVSLRDRAALGDADDAVGFAYTEFEVAKDMDAEMRGAADDNLTVWVNGVKVFAFEEWRNGVRLDRHRFPVGLRAGRNTVLVKVCQSSAPNPEPNWEFFLRVNDSTGKGISKKNLESK
jgi:hypothetical protein